MEKIRVIRILEYVGESKWIERTLDSGYVPVNGIKVISDTNFIKSVLVDGLTRIIE